MVAHFDYYDNTGASFAGPKGVVLIPPINCSTTKMNTTDTTVGGYKASIANATACPAIASALSTVLGSYLLNFMETITTELNANTPSMRGAGASGAATNYEWASKQCILPTEMQIYGAPICTSSWVDIGMGCNKLAIFNFVTTVKSSRTPTWTRCISSSGAFTYSDYNGHAILNNASFDRAIKPIIYIG